MGRIFHLGFPAGVFFTALALTLDARASHYSNVEDLWERYCRVVANRDEVEVLACYEEKLRTQLTGDKTAAGRARLDMHMSDMFELLVRGYDFQVTDQKEAGGKVTYNMKFKHRKKHTEHTTTVVFTSDNDRWYIAKSPDSPEFLNASGGSTTMIIGVVVAIIAIGLLAKKFLK